MANWDHCVNVSFGRLEDKQGLCSGSSLMAKCHATKILKGHILFSHFQTPPNRGMIMMIYRRRTSLINAASLLCGYLIGLQGHRVRGLLLRPSQPVTEEWLPIIACPAKVGPQSLHFVPPPLICALSGFVRHGSSRLN